MNQNYSIGTSLVHVESYFTERQHHVKIFFNVFRIVLFTHTGNVTELQGSLTLFF